MRGSENTRKVSVRVSLRCGSAGAADQSELQIAIHLEAGRHETEGVFVSEVRHMAALSLEDDALVAVVLLEHQIGVATNAVERSPEGHVLEIAAKYLIGPIRASPELDLVAGLPRHLVEESAKGLVGHPQGDAPRRDEGSQFEARQKLVRSAAHLGVGVAQRLFQGGHGRNAFRFEQARRLIATCGNRCRRVVR